MNAWTNFFKKYGFHLCPNIYFGIFLFSMLIIGAGGHIVTYDEETIYRVTQNILSGRDLAVRSEWLLINAQDYPGFLPTKSRHVLTTSVTPGRYGKTYIKSGIGPSLIAIPLYFLGTLISRLYGAFYEQEGARIAVSMLNPLALAGCGWLVDRFGRDLGYRNSTARWLALAFVFTTFAWPYVKTFYPQPCVAFLLLIMVYSSYRWIRDGYLSWLWLLGISCASLIMFRASEIFILPSLVFYLSIKGPRERRWRWVIPVGLSILIAFCLTALYNWLRFGSIISTGYTEIAWTTPFFIGFVGLLFSPGKGFFFYAPVLILSTGAWILFAKKNRAESLLIAGISLSFLCFYAPYKYWTGGWNWGPRFLLPIVPLCILPLGALLDGKHRPLAWGSFLLLFTIGGLLQLPAILVDHSRYLYRATFESEVSNAYTMTIFDPEYSPLWNQWAEALQVIDIYRQKEGWQAAAESLAALEDVAENREVINGIPLLKAEFFRLNTIDFWWLQPKYANFTTPVGWLVLPWLVLAAVGLGLMKFADCHAGE